MIHSLRHRLGAALLATATLAVASCGGGGTTVTPGPGGQTGNGGNQVPELPLPGPPQYPGQQLPNPPDNTNPGDNTPDNPPFVYQNIFAVPITSNGQGNIVATSLSADGTGRLGFLPGQKVAMVMVNTNPAFLDAKYDETAQRFPVIPSSAYSVSADLVSRGASSMASWEDIQAETAATLGSNAGYNGMSNGNGTASPTLIYEREALAQGSVPYSVPAPSKAVSVIQKGETRSFANVAPTIPPPPIGPDPDDPQRQIDDLAYPFEYTNSQRGRLVAIGAHCLIFLSTEINNGFPDTVRFTEARLNAMAQEFDTKIFPTTQAAFGPVANYDEANLFRDIDQTIRLDATDFNQDGTLIQPLPGTVDTGISAERKIIIFLFNSVGGGGGFYSPGLSAGARQKLIDEGREDELERFAETGSTLYIDASNLPANNNSWSAANSIVAHEFQHKLYHDNGLPTRMTTPGTSNFQWFNEGQSQMSIHVNGYTANSGNIADFVINGHLTSYLSSINVTPVPADSTPQINTLAQYGGGFLFFLYLYEHYDPGVGKRIYAASKAGETNVTKLLEAGAKQTYIAPGPDNVLGTADDQTKSFNDSFTEVYLKFALANFIDGIYAANDNALFDPRFHYNTIDLRGTVNLATGTVVLPGVRTGVYPQGGGSYPVIDIHRPLSPWCMDYLVFTNGNSGPADVRDLNITVFTDPNMKMFMLPTNYNSVQNAAVIVDGVTIPTSL